jgi:AAA domain
MRIAVSGTHCCGKSTLVAEFLAKHREFVHEPEPYVALQEYHGEIFAEEPSVDDYFRQLEFNVERLKQYKTGDRVIYERSPADFLAYVLALYELQREKQACWFVQRTLEIVSGAVELLDLIVFLPLEDDEEVIDSEDNELRSAVNSRLVGILCDGEFNLFQNNRPCVLEARGSTAQRLSMIEAVIDRRRNKSF